MFYNIIYLLLLNYIVQECELSDMRDDETEVIIICTVDISSPQIVAVNDGKIGTY